MSKSGTKVLVTDLDNTLWDWFAAWYESFSAMLDALEADSGVPRDELESQIRDVHRRYGTTEYSNLVNEVPALVDAAHGREPWKAFSSAISRLRSERERWTQLYPGVLETLLAIKNSGFKVIAYTESLAYWTEWRITKTGLDGVIDVLYSSPDHDLPRGMTFGDLRSRPNEHYGLKHTKHRHVAKGVLKPNAQVLLEILSANGFSPETAHYVGDSLMKDVAMAQAARVADIHAKYGEPQHRPEYDLLRRVTHWTDADVARERAISSATGVTKASNTCFNRFDEILPILDVT